MTIEPDPKATEPTAGARQVDDVNFHELGKRLVDLGEQLRLIGSHTAAHKFEDAFDRAVQIDVPEVWAEYNATVSDAIRRTLAGMGSFRKDYANWERIVVEYALTKDVFTQREVARLLGVGLSTVNRWAQHPLSYED
ncbi:hypothetical protein GCM10009792_16080 [Microcella alkalica]|uniref:Homeodomain-like domain-containing protein n=1 Tax=Microcella alkalica TaxID=355930 RepID=A0A839E6Q8_9MICO|nr:hypothetical protein [Microcella alkalica]MBA8848349.1 hypothetical protein [Microcella alkalica]